MSSLASPPWTQGIDPTATRPSGLVSYLRSQLAAALATATDFALLVLTVELMGLWYVAAAALGAMAGGVVAFLVNRHWSFVAWHAAARRQALRYALVWIGSLLLNVLLVYAFTDGLEVPYHMSKVAAAVLVGAGFNFPLHRSFVFR